jgi:hypothetical protein
VTITALILVSSFRRFLPQTKLNQSPAIKLASLSNLQRLSFVTANYEGYRVSDAEAMWNSIAKMLRNSALTRSLEELNVVIKAGRVVAPDFDHDPLFGTQASWWTDIDTVLGDPLHAPNLFQVHVGLDAVGYDASMTKQNFSLLVAQKLPRLEESGVLSATLYDNFDWEWLL